jgi:hypothetical protein
MSCPGCGSCGPRHVWVCSTPEPKRPGTSPAGKGEASSGCQPWHNLFEAPDVRMHTDPVEGPLQGEWVRGPAAPVDLRPPTSGREPVEQWCFWAWEAGELARSNWEFWRRTAIEAEEGEAP